MKHARPDYDRIQDPDGLIPEDEPVFLIRGQDEIGWLAVVCWARAAEESGSDPKIVAMAREHSERMRTWRPKKIPDLPADILHASSLPDEKKRTAMTDTPADHPSDLSVYLRRQIHERDWSLRDAEAHIGLSKTTLANIMDKSEVSPSLETLQKIAVAFDRPLWRVIEMAGIDLGLPPTSDVQIQKLISLRSESPQVGEITTRLLEVDPVELEGILVYIEVLQQRKERGTRPRV